jgi:hypothetical protein
MALVPVYNIEQATVVGANAVNAAVTVDTNGLVLVPGGTGTVAIAASKTANTVVKASVGRLCRVLVTTVGTSTTVSIFDNATTNSGTVIGIFPGTAVAGTVYDFEMPAVNGITVGGASTNPALTVSFL